MTNTLKVTIKLFAAYQEAYGKSELALEFPQNTPVAAVRERLISEHPQLSQWRDVTRFGINLQFVEPDTLLQDGDEVVLIPPSAVVSERSQKLKVKSQKFNLKI
ncbi:MoaD/ThiS family protein [Chroococcidiopsis sp. CCNUC1]|uniref:MoaD/ThiS family protein n=1 Tax=Chroococcidiopsis sp. CCNUC1 TaxID=2653189 RepID=UPI002021EDFA|nr:MoaD/ThiS family protein [Chroococcidiopsis sp. CCNUC1]URD53092.1 MoaD/ThiS family protein [Chroococcidiopsis sp. CCNUC1]